MRPIDGYSLWLGHVGDAADHVRIVEAGILAVVDLALNEPPSLLPRDRTYCRFPLIDGPGNSPWLIKAAIETVACFLRSGTPTLVFCGAGMSRSPCIAGAAIALERGCSLEDGLKIAVRSGPADVCPALWADICAILAV